MDVGGHALLVPGRTCSQLFPAPRSGVLVDAQDFYRAVYDACCKAERSIVMTGWQFESKVALLHGCDADGCEHPVRFADFLRDLCEKRPELEIHILAWDASPIFTFEREWMQRLKFHVKGHERVHYKMDNAHPTGACHHQKMIVVDRSIAFVGGMDVCNARWDDRSHAAVQPERCSDNEPYGPYHDVQAYVTGDAVDELRTWFRERWRRATGDELPERDLPRREIAIRPTFDIDASAIGLTRTMPRTNEPPAEPISELYELHLRAIALAERVIYIENQYFSSDELCTAFERRMSRGGPPLEIVVMLPWQNVGFKERISVGIYQQRILERLTKAAEASGHRLGVYFTAAKGPDGDVPVFIHAKVLAVDDRFLLVSSANTTNRSMGFDTELGLAWETPEPNESLRRARVDLLAEHCGVSGDDVERVIGPIDDLVSRLDELARTKQHRLRIHGRNESEKPGPFLAPFIPDETPFDPDNPQSMEDTLPEVGVWFDRVLRDPFMLLRRGARTFGRRIRRRMKSG